MNSDGTKGRRGGAGKPWDDDRSRSSSRREAGGPAGGGFRRQDTPYTGGGRPRDDDDQGWRPFPPRQQEGGFRGRDQRSSDDRRSGGQDRFNRGAGRPGDDRPPFRGPRDQAPRDNDADERPRFRDAERPSFGRDRQGDRPPFRGGDRDRSSFRGDTERPPFRGDNERPPFRGDNERPPFRGDTDRPAPRGDDRDRPPFRGSRYSDMPVEQPTYRQGRGGYRQYEQRSRDDDRAGGRPRSFEDRPRDGGRPFERPPFGDRAGGRREEGSPFEGAGRPLGTSTRMGRSPVNQFERIQADIYGRWPVLESLRAGNVTRVYLAAGVRDTADHLQEIQTLAAEQHIPVTRVDRFALDNVLGGVNHQGIAASAKPFSYTSFEDLMAGVERDNHQPLLVLFDTVQDPQNLGSIYAPPRRLARMARCCPSTTRPASRPPWYVPQQGPWNISRSLK